MRIYPVAKPYIDQSDINLVTSVLKSGSLSLGPYYTKFEKMFAQYVGTKYACSVANGTCGLHLAIRSLGLKPGDEVITSPFSFISSSNCLLFESLIPKFIDIEETTCNMDPQNLEKQITKKTKAILPVHIFGQPCNMDKILNVAKKFNLKIIEDACESLGAGYKGKMAGTFGQAGVFAFYPNKQMTTGEGGMIVTNSKKINDLIVSLRNQGRNRKNDWLIHERLGYNYRLDEMSAALGITQLKKLGWMINQKRHIAQMYSQALSGNKSIIVPRIGKNRTHTWFVYVIRITNGSRNKVMDELGKIRIYTRPYLPVIHLQPFMKKMFNFSKGDFPIAEKLSSQTLALPLYIGLNKKDVQYISNKIIDLINYYD